MPTTQDEVRRLALALPGAEESTHHGRPDFRVGGKIFATLPTEIPAVNVKITPENLGYLVAREPETFSRIWGERWVGIDLSRIDVDEVKALVEDSWRLAAPKRLLRELDDRSPA